MGSNVLVWSDIPVLDLDRASKFYAHITEGAVFPMEGADGVALIMGKNPPERDSNEMVEVAFFLDTEGNRIGVQQPG